MAAKSGVRGMQHPNCKLTDAKVRNIFYRANKGEKQESLAIEFGVNQRTISAIKRKKRWRHLWENN